MNYALKIVVSSGKGEANDECNIPLVHGGVLVDLSVVRVLGRQRQGGRRDKAVQSMTRTEFAQYVCVAALKRRVLCDKTRTAWIRGRFSLIGPALLCPRDLHQYLPIFTCKNQFDTQRRGASNSKDTAQDACRFYLGFFDSGCAGRRRCRGKIGGCVHRRGEWPWKVRRSSAVQERKTFSSILAY